MTKTFQLFIVQILLIFSVLFLHKDKQMALTVMNFHMSTQKIMQVFNPDKEKKSDSKKSPQVIIEESKEEIKMPPLEETVEKTVTTKKTDYKILNYDIVGRKQNFDNTLFTDSYTEINGVLTFRGNQY